MTIKNAGIEQIDLFASFFPEENHEISKTKAVETQKPKFTMNQSKPPETKEGCNSSCDSDDSDLPNFAEHEQGLNHPSTGQAQQLEQKKEKKFEEINRDWIICIGPTQIPFTQRGVTLEKIRQWIEKKYPQFTKQRTVMTYDEKKGIIVPVVTAAKKGNGLNDDITGYFFSREEFMKNPHPINILAARDGYFQIEENDIGVFCVKSPTVQELPLCMEGFQMKLPKIPFGILNEILSFFRSYCQTDGETEVMAQVFWSKSKQDYFIEIPEQKVSKNGLLASLNFDLQIDPNYVQVLQIHSHNSMESYWSETDNLCEVGTMIYGVVGNLDQFYPSIHTRIAVSGKFLEVPVSTIFEDPFSVSIPRHWHDKVVVVNRGERQC